MNVQFMIHIDQVLDTATRTRTESDLKSSTGVKDVEFNLEKPHFLAVEYDPVATSVAQIVASIRSNGLDAQAVAM
jgi:hypothetical protein